MHSRWKRTLIALLLIALFGFAACSDDDDNAGSDDSDTSSESTDSGDDAAASVTIKDRAFSPDSLTVSSGDTIEVTNEDSVNHTFTSDDAGFDTEVAGGESGTARVSESEPGTYDFRCTIHPEMKGTITVE